MVIYQGDQYSIPFYVKMGEESITPENSKDVVIALGDNAKGYAEGKLVFLDGSYLYKLTAEETLLLDDDVSCQVQVFIGKDVLHSKPFTVKIKEIKEVLKTRLKDGISSNRSHN